jgi:hypothetical protein
LRISLRHTFHEALQRVCLVLKVFLIYRFSICFKFSETPITHGIYTRVQRLFLFIRTTATTLRTNNRVKKSFGITIEQRIASRATNFFKLILSFLVHGGSFTVNTLN